MARERFERTLLLGAAISALSLASMPIVGARIAFAPDGEGVGGGAADTGAGAGGIVETKPDLAQQMYPNDKADDGEKPEGEAGEKTPEQVEAEKAAADPKVKAAAEAEAAKAARKAELEKMTPEDRIKAEKADADKSKADAEALAKGIPEDGKYEIDSSMLADGMTIDQTMLDAVSPALKEAGVTREGANTLAKSFAKFQADDYDRRMSDWGQTLDGWIKEAQSDEEMGGTKWKDTEKRAVAAVERFGNPKLKAYLDASGAGNHPEMIRLFNKIGELISEDTVITSDTKAGGGKSDALATLYPDDVPKS